MSEGEFLARAAVDAAADADDYRVAVRSGRHAFAADEPVATGGANTGPSPFGLLLSSLGACTAITLRMYAQRKGWDIGDVHVELKYLEREDGNRYIERSLRVGGALSDEQRERLLEIAGKTPVTKALQAGTPIETTMT